MTIGEEAMKIGDEERMEITADEAASEGGVGFEAEGVFEGVSGVVVEGTVEGGERNDNFWVGEIGSLFDKRPNVIIYVCALKTLN